MPQKSLATNSVFKTDASAPPPCLSNAESQQDYDYHRRASRRPVLGQDDAFLFLLTLMDKKRVDENWLDYLVKKHGDEDVT